MWFSIENPIIENTLKVIQLRPDSSENPFCSIGVPTGPDCSGMFDCISILKKIYFGSPTTPNSCISKIRSKYCVSFETLLRKFETCLELSFKTLSRKSETCLATLLRHFRDSRESSRHVSRHFCDTFEKVRDMSQKCLKRHAIFLSDFRNA